jgi:hypothetical protein
MVTKKKALKKKPKFDERVFEHWVNEGRALKVSEHQWDIADWLLRGEKISGLSNKEAYKRAVTLTGMTEGTLRQFAHTARNVLTRVNGLSFGHHRLVAKYTPEQQKRYLDYAKDARKSVDGFAGYLRNLDKDKARRAEKRSRADVAAAKVMEACDTLLRNHHFERLFDEAPTPAAGTEVLERLKKAIAELSNRVEQMEMSWGRKAAGAGAGK